jgi:hypothetical protein
MLELRSEIDERLFTKFNKGKWLEFHPDAEELKS